MRLIEMASLFSLFDRYELCARVLPSAIVIIPPVISCYLWFPQVQTIHSIVVGIVIFILILIPMSKHLRNEGRKKQKVLFECWGGAPTTVILRCSNKTLDLTSKQRYKKCLEDSIDGLSFPSEEEEGADPGKADEIYNSAVRWLREKTRNKETYQLVFEENLSYGFSRNLCAVRPLALSVLILTLFVNICALCIKYRTNIMSIPPEIIILICILLLDLYLWIRFITDDVASHSQ
jgi:hypothetical protein